MVDGDANFDSIFLLQTEDLDYSSSKYKTIKTVNNAFRVG